MNQQENIQTEYEEEIDLMDYIKVIFKRKWLILVIFLVAVIAAGVFSYFAPKIYKISASFEIGIIGDKIIEEPNQVIGKINGDAYGILVREKLGILEYPEVKAENPKGTNLVITETESINPELTKNVLNEINNLIIEDHQREINLRKELLEKEIQGLQESINYLISKNQEIVLLQLKLHDLQKQKENFQPTQVILKATVSKKPIKPKLALNIIIAGVLGIFVGLFFAFGKEWWEKNRT
ncbi:MAG: YveK family protein [Candidatus Nealsonbacteria bacterium]